jgi:2-polyprenyl-6-methoxyphenol hydroxylase-like FAD-dependent oxidoreductase
MHRLEIAVCGAGTTGLAAAAFLARAGHRVRVLERFERPRPLGAGLLLQPTGLAVLAQLGIDREAIGAGARIERLTGETAGGHRVMAMAYADLAPHYFGVGIHRASLFSLLHDAAAAAGAEIVPDAAVAVSATVSGGRTVGDLRGRTHGPFDLVVDATGMRSPLRDGTVARARVRPFRYGAVWRAVRLPADWPHRSDLRQRYESARIMIGVLPIGRLEAQGEGLAALFWSLGPGEHAAWSRDIPGWRESVARLWPAVAPMLAEVESAADMAYASYDDVVVPVPIAERYVVLGDAAHCTSPQLGQGANLGLLDATLLAAALDTSDGDLAGALESYAAIRRRHVRFYQTASRWLTPFFQSDSRLAGWARDLALPIAGRIPYVRRQMVETLCGIKTGPFSRLDPGRWEPRYALAEPVRARQPA